MQERERNLRDVMRKRPRFLGWLLQNKMMLFVIIVAVVLIFGALMVFSLKSVPLGEKLVIIRAPDEVRIGEVLDEGWHFDLYYLLCEFASVRYNSQSVEFIGMDEGSDHFGSIAVRSTDNLEIFIDFSVTYHIPAENVGALIVKNGADYQHVVLNQVCRSVPRDEASRFSALDMIGEKRADIEQAIDVGITAKLAESGIVVESFNMRDIRPPASVSQAIEDKKVAEQYLITAGYQAQSRVVLAQGNLTATLINANATAQAQVIKANGSAEAIGLIMDMFRQQDPDATNVTLNYLTWLYIQALSDPSSNIAYIIVPQGNGVPVLIQTPPPQ